MAASSLFDRVCSALFGGSQSDTDPGDPRLVDDLIEAVVEFVEPRVRLRSGYRKKLERCMRASVAYLRSIGRQGLDPILLTRLTWREDARVNAFFATANDVPACLGRSQELRDFFENPANHEVQDAFALLGMKKEEKNVLGTQLQEEKVLRDVAQVTVNFSEHRLVAPSATLAATRLEIGKRIILRLAQVSLSRIVELDMKATELQEHKAYLGARLRMLNLARDGMQGIVEDPATIEEQAKTIEQELKQTVDNYIEAKSSLATLDGYIKQISDVFSHPEKHVNLTHSPVRVSSLGIKVDEAYSGAVNELTLAELSIGADLRAVAIVRCPRSELPPKEDLIANAERYL
jgi:hypothetical protein